MNTLPRPTGRKVDPSKCWVLVKSEKAREGKWSVQAQCSLRPVVQTLDGKVCFCKRHTPKNQTVGLVPFVSTRETL